MKIITPIGTPTEAISAGKVVLLASTVNPEALCGKAAAVCMNSNSPGASLSHAMRSGHESVLEHATFTFEIDGLSRAALAQLTRHRIASFDVQSQRYVKIGANSQIIPDSIACSPFLGDVEEIMMRSMNLYSRMVEAGIPPEDARYVTTQAVTTKLVMTMNARELRHFFSLRTCNRAQWEIRRIADKMLKICKQTAPALFADAGPGCVRGVCPEAKPCDCPRQSDDWAG